MDESWSHFTGNGKPSECICLVFEPWEKLNWTPCEIKRLPIVRRGDILHQTNLLSITLTWKKDLT